MVEAGRLTEKEYWLETSEQYTMGRHNAHTEVVELIKKHIPKGNNKSCIEIGSFPGPFLATLGDLGYELNGIDYNPRNKSEVAEWLYSEKLNVNEFYSEDFFKFIFPKKYDVVCSFGFIEHFENFENVIQMHIDMCTENGVILITTPNFKGALQYWLHQLLDAENLKQHHVPAMDLEKWKKVLSQNNFEIIYANPFGGLKFWVEKSHKRNIVQKITLWFVERIIIRIAKLLKRNSTVYSPYLGIIAKRKI